MKWWMKQLISLLVAAKKNSEKENSFRIRDLLKTPIPIFFSVSGARTGWTREWDIATLHRNRMWWGLIQRVAEDI